MNRIMEEERPGDIAAVQDDIAARIYFWDSDRMTGMTWRNRVFLREEGKKRDRIECILFQAQERHEF